MTPTQAVVVCGVGIAYAGLFFWLIGVVHTLREDVDAARDESDRALGGVQAVHDHLAGAEPAGTGRHAAQKTTEYRRDKTLPMPVVESATPGRPGRATDRAQAITARSRKP